MSLLRARGLLEAGFAHAFPTRNTADRELIEGLGAGHAGVVQVRQVHGARVVEAAGARNQEADAIVARGRLGRVAVGVRVADCVPVLVGDPSTGDVAAIHAGWRGVVAGVVGEAIGALLRNADAPAPNREHANDRSRAAAPLLAAIGPCIGPCCFEVGLDVAARIGFVVLEAGDKAYVDLRAAVRAQLAAAGLTGEHIEDVPGCTRHEPERFHSFRRDGKDSGRMLAAIAAIDMD
jgi:YfiH family protein